MVSGGIAAPRVLGANDSVIHQLDISATQQGGPFVDVVTLFVENPTAGDLDLVLTVAGGSPITQTIKSKTVAVVVLDQVPFQAAPNSTASAASQILGHGALLVFWGWFARPL